MKMESHQKEAAYKPGRKLSLDWLAVICALVAVAMARAHVLPHISW